MSAAAHAQGVPCAEWEAGVWSPFAHPEPSEDIGDGSQSRAAPGSRLRSQISDGRAQRSGPDRDGCPARHLVKLTEKGIRPWQMLTAS